MEEAELLKERLLAITDKRKVQEDLSQRKLEVDQHKHKLQHLKKKALRDQWLMDGSSAQTSHQRQNLLEDQQQTRLLQLNIHRIEKEIEALEREESLISTNEGFILKRLRAVEKSSEDIIKEAKENFKTEPVQFSPVPPVHPMSYKPLTSRLQQDNKPKQTLFAMEINVQKDLRTGESRVVSTATVTPQELEQRGVKVYDDGRKCVYAMRCEGAGPGPGAGPAAGLGLGSHGVDELTPSEVEQLLRAATESEQQRRRAPPARRCNAGRGHQRELLGGGSRATGRLLSTAPPCASGGGRAQGSGPPGYKQSHDRNQEVPLGYYPTNRIPADPFDGRKEEKFYRPANGYHDYHHHHHQSPAPQSYSELYRLPPSVFYDSAPQEERYPSPIYQDDPPFRILNAMPANQDAAESVTAVFMGYQTAEDDQGPGYEGAIKAELVVIDDDDDDDDGRAGESRRGSEGYRNYGYQQDRYGPERREGREDGRQGSGIRKIQRTQKHCCSVM